MPYCQNCGAQVDLEDSFCEKCGFDLKAEEVEEEQIEGETIVEEVAKTSYELDECPYCSANSVKQVGGIQSFGEFATFFILIILLIIPGILYYIEVQKIPYCTNCHRRVHK